MGLRDKLFGSRREPKPVELPALLQPEPPVNYDSVLEWMLGLSDKDYGTMIECINIYREARKNESKLLKLKNTATTQLLIPAQTDEEIDSDLDMLLETDPKDLKASLEQDNG